MKITREKKTFQVYTLEEDGVSLDILILKEFDEEINDDVFWMYAAEPGSPTFREYIGVPVHQKERGEILDETDVLQFAVNSFDHIVDMIDDQNSAMEIGMHMLHHHASECDECDYCDDCEYEEESEDE